jgi:hypothetical protein
VVLFFNEGIIRVSTFEVFSRHPNEFRRDAAEGSGMVFHTNPEVNDGKGITVSALMSTGKNAYILCGSTVCTDETKERFGSSGIIINDSVGFAITVSRHLLGFLVGVEGLCRYVPKRMINRNVGNFELDDLKARPDSKDIDANKLFSVVAAAASDDLFFLKPDKYAHYRLFIVN